VRRNPQHRSLSHFRASDSTSSSAKLLPPTLNRFTRQTFPTINRNHFLMNILWIESFCPRKKAQQNAALRYYTVKHGRHFDYWNQPLCIRMRVCYLDCHEVGLCCYLVIHIENLLRPLQLFNFHLWIIYWLSVVVQSRLLQINKLISCYVHLFLMLAYSNLQMNSSIKQTGFI
jgi:hypothetical protein